MKSFLSRKQDEKSAQTLSVNNQTLRNKPKDPQKEKVKSVEDHLLAIVVEAESVGSAAGLGPASCRCSVTGSDALRDNVMSDVCCLP